MCSCQQTLKPIKVTVTEFRSILNTETGDTLVFSLELGNKNEKGFGLNQGLSMVRKFFWKDRYMHV